MLVLLSPSKTQDFSFHSDNLSTSIPHFQPQIKELVKVLSDLNSPEIAKLMNLSTPLADLNFNRFQNFKPNFTPKNSTPALFAFKGDVYTDIQVTEYNHSELDFANQHLRILSGLYGLLKPLDLIQPYRLEMKTKLKTDNYSNLYQYWNTQITDFLNQEKANYIINLASEEYFKVLQTKNLKIPVITVNFKQLKNSDYKIVPIYAKKARGTLANYIVKNKLTNPLQLKEFNLDNYSFNQKLSLDNNFIFTRDQEI